MGMGMLGFFSSFSLLTFLSAVLTLTVLLGPVPCAVPSHMVATLVAKWSN